MKHTVISRLSRSPFLCLLAAAVLGIASAKFASGRWTIFGLRAPTLITGPRGMGIGWQAQF